MSADRVGGNGHLQDSTTMTIVLDMIDQVSQAIANCGEHGMPIALLVQAMQAVGVSQTTTHAIVRYLRKHAIVTYSSGVIYWRS